MINQNHPIIPPPELVRDWARYQNHQDPEALWRRIATLAARWGADQELEACCEWFQEFYKTESWVEHDLKHLRVARRPKPPSLKEQALALLDKAEDPSWDINDFSIVRQALGALPND